jgi:hypothetical protein
MRANVRDLGSLPTRRKLRAPGNPGNPGTSFLVRVNVELRRAARRLGLERDRCSVDEALARAERLRTNRCLTDQRTIRLIHGYGTDN